MTRKQIAVSKTRLRKKQQVWTFETMTNKFKSDKLYIKGKKMLNQQIKNQEKIVSTNERQRFFSKYQNCRFVSSQRKCRNSVPIYKLITFTMMTIVIASILITKSDIIDSVVAEAQTSLFNHPIYHPPSSSNRMLASSPLSSILKRDLSAKQEATTSSMTGKYSRHNSDK